MAATMVATFSSGYAQAYRGKQNFLDFLDLNLTYNAADGCMVFREDVTDAYGQYCRENGLHAASVVKIGHHFKASGVRVRRFGPPQNQRYCYVGFSWKNAQYETVSPAKRGRKPKPDSKRRRNSGRPEPQPGADFLNYCTGELPRCTLEWDGAGLTVRDRPFEVIKKDLEMLMASGDGWWNEEIVREKEVKKAVDEEVVVEQKETESSDEEMVDGPQEGIEMSFTEMEEYGAKLNLLLNEEQEPQEGLDMPMIGMEECGAKRTVLHQDL